MSNLLLIKKNGNIYLDENLVTTDGISDINGYLSSLLGFYVTIESGIKLGDLVHSLYGLKKFIGDYFSEDYEVLRAFTNSTKIDGVYSTIKFYKSFKVENDDLLSEFDREFLYVLPEIKFENNENGFLVDKLGELEVVVDEQIVLKHGDVELKLNSKFTLLNILECIFQEISGRIQEGEIFTGEQAKEDDEETIF